MSDHVISAEDAADEIVGNTIIGFDQISDREFVLHVMNGQPLRIVSVTPVSFFMGGDDVQSTPAPKSEPEEGIGVCRFCGFSVPESEMCQAQVDANECAGVL